MLSFCSYRYVSLYDDVPANVLVLLPSSSSLAPFLVYLQHSSNDDNFNDFIPSHVIVVSLLCFKVIFLCQCVVMMISPRIDVTIRGCCRLSAHNMIHSQWSREESTQRIWMLVRLNPSCSVAQSYIMWLFSHYHTRV